MNGRKSLQILTSYNAYLVVLLNLFRSHCVCHGPLRVKANSHPAKLVFQPTQSLEFLRFVPDSVLIRVTIPVTKVDEILALCRFFLAKRLFTIRHVASLIRTHVSTFPGIELGPLHYRRLERDKYIALRDTLDDFEGLMSLPPESIGDLNWWIVSLPSAYRSIDHGIPGIDVTLTSDASLRD